MKYPVGRRSPAMSAHSFHSCCPSPFTVSCQTVKRMAKNSPNTGFITAAVSRVSHQGCCRTCNWKTRRWKCGEAWTHSYPESVSGVSDVEEGVVDGVAHQRRAPPQLGGPPIAVVVVGQRPVSQHHGDVRVRPLPGNSRLDPHVDPCRTTTLDAGLDLRRG